MNLQSSGFLYTPLNNKQFFLLKKKTFWLTCLKITKNQYNLSNYLLYKTIYYTIYPLLRTFLIKGLGYKLTLYKQNLMFKLGNSHITVIKLPLGIQIKKIGKYLFTIRCNQLEELSYIMAAIKKLKKKELYTVKGIWWYKSEKLKKKVGKKKTF